MKYTWLFLISISAFAQEGLELLNYFPKTDSFFETSVFYQYGDLEIEDLDEDTYEDKDEDFVLQARYGRKLNSYSFWAVSLPLVYKEENYLRYGAATEKTYIFKGLREPELTYFYRLRKRNLDGGTHYTDIEFGLIPGLFPKIAGGDASGWNGRSVFKSKLSHGALYDKYEGKLTGLYEYFSWGEGSFPDEDLNYTSAPYYRLTVNLDLQMADGDWRYYISSGVSFTSDHDVKTKGESTTVQLGTASMGEVGAKYILDDAFLRLSYGFHRNDIFTKNNVSGNYRGDYALHSFTLSYTKDL